jgi:hypothetical protein
MNQTQEKLLEAKGWRVECLSPLEIRHHDGSFATQYAADCVIDRVVADAGIARIADACQDSETRIGSTLRALNAHLAALLIIGEVAQAENNEDAWKVAFDLLFSEMGSRTIRNLCHSLNLGFSYYDPDSSYQEDVEAFLAALKELKGRISPLMGKIPR